jgi:signal transduction histidine kinase
MKRTLPPVLEAPDSEEQIREVYESVAAQIRHFSEVQKTAVMALSKLFRGYMKPEEVAGIAARLLKYSGYSAIIAVGKDAQIGFKVDDSTSFIVPLAYFEKESQLNHLGYMAISDFNPEKEKQGRMFLEYYGRRVSLAVAHAELFWNLRAARDTLLDMASFVRHEVRGPLSTNYGLLKIISHHMEQVEKVMPEGVGGEIQEMIRRCCELAKSAQVASEKINLSLDLLEIYNINSQVVKPEKDEISWEVFLKDEVRGQFEQIAHCAGVNLKMFVQHDILKEPLCFKRVWISRIFDNLVSNAFKYSLQNSSVELWFYRDEGRLVLDLWNRVEYPVSTVSLEIMMEKGATTSNKSRLKGLGEGHGLGLYLVNLIVRNGFGGDLILKSGEGYPSPPRDSEGFGQLSIKSERFNKEAAGLFSSAAYFRVKAIFDAKS